jgi:hypothetical protein
MMGLLTIVTCLIIKHDTQMDASNLGTFIIYYIPIS